MFSFNKTHLFRILPGAAHHPARFILFFIRRCIDEGIDQASAALAFSLLLALVPMATISLNLLALFPESSAWVHAFEGFLEKNLLPDRAANVITTYTLQFSENAAYLTRAGLIMLAVTTFLMLHTMEQVLNRLWKVEKPRPWLRRVTLYLLLVVLSPLIVGALFLGMSNLLRFLLGLVSHQSFYWIDWLLYASAEFLILVLFLAFLYIALPNTTVRLKPALIAGTFATAGIVLARKLFSLYLIHFPSYSLLYGVFAVLPIFLLWQYLTWAIVLAGSLLCATLQTCTGEEWSADERVND